jgi:transcriptional regulator with XRE-family HTH domain
LNGQHGTFLRHLGLEVAFQRATDELNVASSRVMPSQDHVSHAALVVHVSRVLGLNQRQLGELLGVSLRTVARWTARQSYPSPTNFHAMARAVFPRDASLAVQLATSGGTTLEELGVQQASVAARTGGASSIPDALLVESIVCAAATAMDASPRALRPALAAAFDRARTLRLTVESIDAVLRDPADARAKPAADAK